MQNKKSNYYNDDDDDDDDDIDDGDYEGIEKVKHWLLRWPTRAMLQTKKMRRW